MRRSTFNSGWSPWGRFASVVLAAASPQLAAATLPASMSFVAQSSDTGWKFYRVQANGAPVVVETAAEPRQACLSVAAERLVYAAADGSIRLRELLLGNERIVAQSDSSATYTQPCLSADGKTVYAVEMKDGKSVETEIIRLPERPGASTAVLARQPGAQLEPFLHAGRWLTYGSIACSEGCDHLMEEVWIRDLLTGSARQLTLLNAVSQGPVTDGRRVVFSNNADGAYALYEADIGSGVVRRLTRGADNDLFPAICAGHIYFVRQSPQGVSLMSLGDDLMVKRHEVPGLKGFRSLRCVE